MNIHTGCNMTAGTRINRRREDFDLNIEPKKSGQRDLTRTGSSAGQDIVSRLRADIVSNVFLPEAKLKFAELTKRYDVGIGTLREALSQLVSEGFVTLESGKGFKVARVSREELLEITDHFVDLEKRAIADAIEHGDDVWESQIVAAHHRLSLIENLPWPERMERHAEWLQRHREFHESLVSACQGYWLFRLRSMMFDQLDRYRFLSKMTPEGLGKQKSKEHRLIMQATLDRDAAKAMELIEHHIRDTTNAGMAHFGD
ncbi:GntR family transcriptional regulator [Oricola thermophila]|uniref:GntR family transcriptional regulator n=1 Tax=Oricola thermophila TaxID=2742145 RepID=A0A6N1VHA0_9HYPH|nr:GntR family transcriptional regulator [Oricola thermophila]QKV20158.1 GntR family transcriptional regulator [Oricola thermophila]